MRLNERHREAPRGTERMPQNKQREDAASVRLVAEPDRRKALAAIDMPVCVCAVHQFRRSKQSWRATNLK